MGAKKKVHTSVTKPLKANPLERPTPDANLAQIVYEKILRAITYGRLDLGEPLSENDLAKAFGVSKAPIREGLKELRVRGLVTVVPQSGSYVFSPTREEIEELCDLRFILEEAALRVSMEHDRAALLSALKKITVDMKKAYAAADLFQSKLLDSELHHTFFRHSGNRYLIQAYANIAHSVEALRYRFMDTAVFRHRAFNEHNSIVDHLAKGSIGRATDILSRHIGRTKQFQAKLTWPTVRLQRKDYKFRDYTEVFSD